MYGDFSNIHTAQGIPQMKFDLLKAIAHHHPNCIKYREDYNLLKKKQNEEVIEHQAITDGITPHKFTRKLLKRNEGWETW